MRPPHPDPQICTKDYPKFSHQTRRKNPLVYKGLKHSGFIRQNNVRILFHCSFLITHLSVKSQVIFSLGTVSTPLTSTFANSEDPDEMQHNAAFHQGLHCL